MDSILTLRVDDRQAPDGIEMPGQGSDHSTEIRLPCVRHEQSARLQDPRGEYPEVVPERKELLTERRVGVEQVGGVVLDPPADLSEVAVE
jgi:hypothetical protein